ncbi:hypothetical protein D3C78_1807170 [compost metagenome]
MGDDHALVLEKLAIVRVPANLKIDGQYLKRPSHVVVSLPTGRDGLNLIRGKFVSPAQKLQPLGSHLRRVEILAVLDHLNVPI